jgi:periplasmic copper chaperone A
VDRRCAFSFLLVLLAWHEMPALARSAKGTSGPWRLGDIVVEQAWARLGSNASKTCAVYLTVHNKSANDDYLFAVFSNASRKTAIHETQIVDGVARMEPIPGGLR